MLVHHSLKPIHIKNYHPNVSVSKRSVYVYILWQLEASEITQKSLHNSKNIENVLFE